MVASRHPSSRPAGARSLDAQKPFRPVSNRSPSGSVSVGCRDPRPQLRLVVDNTVCGTGSASAAGSGAGVPGGAVRRTAGGSSSIATELGAWSKASAQLAQARWRLHRQRWINRHGGFGMTDRIAGLGPVVTILAVVVFGGLIGLRFAQESESVTRSDPESAIGSGVSGSVAAVATSTSGAAASSNPAVHVAPDSAVVVVHPGDSLWSIARSRYPDRDPRAVVDAFVEANGASAIRIGQQLIVPADLIEG